jgi:knotted carbamoyltransferase YgeW
MGRKDYCALLDRLNFDKMYESDFFLTWEKTQDELAAVFTVADALRDLRERNISAKIFDSGLGISIFRDNSTRTRFSFSSACNMLGLEVQDLDEGKSQIAHGETLRETANMISFMADVIGIRDDMYIGKGNAYMHAVSDAVREGYREGVLNQIPTLVNLQCDIDHPTQTMADTLHLIHEFGGVENLKGKKGGHDLGLLSFLRKAALRAPGRDRPDDALRYGRCAGPSQGL